MKTAPLQIHPDSPLFPACPFGHQGGKLPGGRVRKQVGDRFCDDPDNLFCKTEAANRHWKPDEAGICQNCGQPKGAHAKRTLVVLTDCLACPWPTSTVPPPPPRPKVGDVLARILKERRGAESSESCGCDSRIHDMNAWGPDGCEQNMETIVGWLLQSASETPGVHRWIWKPVKAHVLRGDVRDAIEEVREWVPPTVVD